MADGRQRKRKPYSLDQLRTIMATAIQELERIYLDEKNNPDQRVRAINSLASLCNSYSKLTEISDLEARISKLENKI